jgi:hypothetical protein
LNSVINYLEVALEEVLNEHARQHLQRSLQASKSLVFVVNDLLNLTEAESSEVSIHEDDVDLRSLVNEVATAYSHESMAKFVNIQLDIDETVPKLVRCDRGGLRQVLSNLLDNAIRQQGQGIVKVILLQISYTDTDSVIEVAFEDQGGGLSELELDEMFQEFEHILDDDDDDYRLSVQPEEEKQLKGRKVSIGLGLAITARFVRLNNGQVSIASELGKGTKVAIKIPFRKALFHNLRNGRTSWVAPLLTPPNDSELFVSSTHVRTELESTNMRPLSLLSANDQNSSRSLRQLDTATFERSSPSPDSPDLKLQSPFSENFGSGSNSFFASKLPQRRLRILIAEDNPLNSRLLETRLSKRSHQPMVTVNGEVCVQRFRMILSHLMRF